MLLNKIAVYKDFFIDYRATLKEAMAKMHHNGDGSVVLLNNMLPVGILTQSNIIKILDKNTDLSISVYSVANRTILSADENRSIEFAFSFLSEHDIRRIILINDKKEFTGVVLQESLFDYMEEHTYKVDLEISHIIKNDYTLITIDKTASLYDASHCMKEHHIGSVIITEKDQVVGILTEKDILRLAYSEVNIQESVKDHMSQPVISVEKNTLVINTISLIRRKNIRRVLVTDSHNKPITILSNHDILKHLKGKRQEKEHLLLHQSKLATMGEMIGHIAHQWRQPLAELGGVFMNIDAAYEFDALNENYLKDKVENGNELIKHMSNTIEDFRNFFTPNSMKEVFEPSKYIQSASNIIQATLVYHNIELNIINLKEPIFISGYPSEFSQVILNLLDNAKDVLIEREVVSPKIVVETTRHHDSVFISVKDNAGGIAQSDINEIFKVYFSTKTKKGGTGLGLYISKLIIENKFLGDIYAKNSTNGAEIIMKIPIVEKKL